MLHTPNQVCQTVAHHAVQQVHQTIAHHELQLASLKCLQCHFLALSLQVCSESCHTLGYVSRST
uniref:Uncharacterized protein n=1 Tax=Arundo donax TaxID=35708 RepID=A0A0A8YJW2_ARUDO